MTCTRFILTDDKDPADNTLEPFTFANYTHDPDVGAVLCGLDLSINYTKLCKAFQCLTRNPGCLFLATNGDSTYPVASGTLPGTGALWSTLRFALNKDPLVIGKPESTMLDCIKAKCVCTRIIDVDPTQLTFFSCRVHFDPARTIMVGDRLSTDIMFGKSGGLATMLVMTGEFLPPLCHSVPVDLKPSRPRRDERERYFRPQCIGHCP